MSVLATTTTRSSPRPVDISTAPISLSAFDNIMQMPVMSPMGLMRRDTGEAADYYEQGELGNRHYSRWRKDELFLEQAEKAGRPMRTDANVTLHDALFPHDIYFKQVSVKKNNLVPSIGAKAFMDQCDQFGSFMLFGFNRDHRGVAKGKRKQCYHLTVAALSGRVKFQDPNYRQDMILSRKRFAAVMRQMREFDPAFSVLLLKEEETLDTESRSLYPHYHVVIAGPNGHKRLQHFMRLFRVLWNRHYHIDEIRYSSEQRVSGYFAKTTEIPRDMLASDLRWFIDHSHHRRKFSRFNEYAAWCQEMSAAGRRVCKIAGLYTLIDRDLDREDREASEEAQEADSATMRADGDATTSTAPEGAESAAESRAKRAKGAMIYCGITTPRPQPGGRKLPYLIVSDYNSNPQSDNDRDENAVLNDASRQVRERYEERTGRKFTKPQTFTSTLKTRCPIDPTDPYHLWVEVETEVTETTDMTDDDAIREYLKPMARRIWDRLTHRDKFYRERITVSPRFMEIIIDILDEDPFHENLPPKRRVPPGECPF